MTELPLVLLPGLDGSGVMFRPLLAHLPPTLKPIVISYPPDKILGYEELLPLVVEKTRDLSRFILLGESFSGPLALMFAVTCPLGLQAVILCASFVRNPIRFHPNWLRHFARPLLFRFYPRLTMLKSILTGYSSPEWRALKVEAIAGLQPDVLAHRVCSALRVDVRKQLIDCPVPILYLRGDHDGVVPQHNLAEIKRIRPTVEVANFPAPHMVLQTQPAATAAAIAAFAEKT